MCDARKNKREGCAYLKPLQTLTAGIPFGRPYSAPFFGAVSEMFFHSKVQGPQEPSGARRVSCPLYGKGFTT